MNCPNCYGEKSAVLETRRLRAVIHRRRRCLHRECRKQFFTTESSSKLLSFPAEIKRPRDLRLTMIGESK